MSSKVKLAADYIFAHIQDGSWPQNSRIPSEHELCAELGISRTSVRGAIAQYVSVGVLESQHGKGTFVRSSDLSLLGGPFLLCLSLLFFYQLFVRLPGRIILSFCISFSREWF